MSAAKSHEFPAVEQLRQYIDDQAWDDGTLAFSGVGSNDARRALDEVVARLRLAEEVAELADHYTDLIAQAVPVDYGDEAWQLLVDALNIWRSRGRGGSVGQRRGAPMTWYEQDDA